jgi:hypothetical protein
MSKTKTFTGKCPNCCPDGGAEFKRWGMNEKRCVNCHHVLPLRQVKPSGKPTVSQEKAIARVLAVFGGSVIKQEMIGRKVWVEIRNDERHWVRGDFVYGAIGPCGQLDLKMPRFGAGEALIQNDIDVSVYLKN